MVISLLVFADSKVEAREKAEEILNERLVGEDGQPFDYGTFFYDEFATNRWEKRPAVVLVDSKEGKQMIKNAMKYTKEDFETHLKSVKELINFYSTEELFEGKILDTKKKMLEEIEKEKENSKINLSLFKYYCNCLGWRFFDIPL